MPVKDLTPDALVHQQLAENENWQKMLLLVIRKMAPNGEPIFITSKDLEAMIPLMDAETNPDPLVLFTWGHQDSFEFRVIPQSKAMALQKHVDGIGKAGGDKQ